MPGPDFPTGGVLVETPENIRSAYETGRGAFRLRARWEVEPLARGQWQVVVTEIPYQVQKSRLIEKIAEMMAARKLPMLEDVRDESAADIRMVLEPRSRTIEPEMMMEALCQHSDLEVRVSLNLNVLGADGTPRVLDLRAALQSWLDHRLVVLKRRARNRLEKIARRLEMLAGYMIVYLNLDEVIAIIREEDEPKPVMIKRWKLNDNQAEAILNMRLRALRRLEEITIRKEIKALEAERKELNRLLKSEAACWQRIDGEIVEIRKRFGAKTELGARRTEIGDAPSADVVPISAMIEREPVTVICSEKGWIRVAKGHLADFNTLKFKEGDRARFAFHAETTDRLILFATNGRFYTLGCDKLPGGRGHGEPVRLMLDLGNDHDIVDLFIHDAERRLVVASSDGRGFIVPEAEVVAQTRAGRQVLNVSGDVEARACAPAVGDSIAVVGDNHKMIVFPLKELPEMTRGRGVKLQNYKDGGLADVKAFTKADGLSWKAGERTRTESDLRGWLGKRSQAGRKSVV